MSAPRTLSGLLDRAVERFGSSRAMLELDTGKSWSFEELAKDTGRLQDHLVDLGVRTGNRVGLVGDNGPEWIIAYLAVVGAGGTVVPLDPVEPCDLLGSKLVAAGVKGVLLGRRLARPGETGSPSRPEVESGSFRIDLLVGKESGVTPPSKESVKRRNGSVAVASLLFTSGTTGNPRAVPITQRSLLAECEALSAIIPLSPLDRTLALVPFHHILGFNVGVMLPLWSGMGVGFLPELSRSALQLAFREFRPTAVCAVPAVWKALREAVEAEVARRGAWSRTLFRILRHAARRIGYGPARRIFLPVHKSFGGSLRTIVTSGAPFEEKEVGFWNDLGFQVLHAYGLTETTGAVNCTRPGDPVDAGVGRPIRGVEVRIRQPDSDGAGEIIARGPVVMDGYEGGDDPGTDPGATNLVEGWLHTGDVGRIDTRGFLHILGRRREVIVTRGGETIYPEAVEQVLAQANYIAELAVVGLGSPGDERVVAVVVPDEEAMLRDGILDLFGTVRYSLLARAAGLPPASRPVDYRILRDPLPRTPTRKLRRLEIRRRLTAGGYGWGPEAMTDRVRSEFPGGFDLGDSPVEKAVASALARVLRPGIPAPRREHFLGSDLGLDSLDRVALICGLEARLKRRLPEHAMRCGTVQDLIEASGREASGPVRVPAALLDADPAPADLAVLRKADRVARTLAPVREFLSLFFRITGRVAFDIQVHGLERIPAAGPYILCSNHQSYLDPYFLVPSLPRKVRRQLWIFAVDWLFRGPISNTYLYTARTLPVDNRSGRFLSGLRLVAHVLVRGESALIYPEGMRSFDGRVGPWRPGAGLLAIHAHVPMIPVAIAGVYQILPPRAWVPRLRDGSGRRNKVHIAFGEPLVPRQPGPQEDPAVVAQEIVDTLRQRTLAMLAEAGWQGGTQ